MSDMRAEHPHVARSRNVHQIGAKLTQKPGDLTGITRQQRVAVQILIELERTDSPLQLNCEQFPRSFDMGFWAAVNACERTLVPPRKI